MPVSCQLVTTHKLSSSLFMICLPNHYLLPQIYMIICNVVSVRKVMLEGWQGWWTSGTYRSGVNQFYWGTGGVIPNSGDFWGFQRPPFVSTCVWILQIPNYNYTLGNYDCFTASGYICEITYRDLLNDP